MGRAGRPNPHPNLFNFSQDTIIWASPLWSLLDRARACIDEELCVRGRNLVQGEGIRGHRYKSGNTAEPSPRLCTCVPNISEELLKRTPVRDLSAS